MKESIKFIKEELESFDIDYLNLNTKMKNRIKYINSELDLLIIKDISILESRLNKEIEDLKKLIKDIEGTVQERIIAFYRGKLAGHEEDLWEINQLKK